jgi:hypothetical protein
MGAILPGRAALLPRVGAILPGRAAPLPRVGAILPGRAALTPRLDAILRGRAARLPRLGAIRRGSGPFPAHMSLRCSQREKAAKPPRRQGERKGVLTDGPCGGGLAPWRLSSETRSREGVGPIPTAPSLLVSLSHPFDRPPRNTLCDERARSTSEPNRTRIATCCRRGGATRWRTMHLRGVRARGRFRAHIARGAGWTRSCLSSSSAARRGGAVLASVLCGEPEPRDFSSTRGSRSVA